VLCRRRHLTQSALATFVATSATPDANVVRPRLAP
jgi:hypothetical protein